MANAALIVVIIVIILFMIAGIGIVIYFATRKSHPPPQCPSPPGSGPCPPPPCPSPPGSGPCPPPPCPSPPGSGPCPPPPCPSPPGSGPCPPPPPPGPTGCMPYPNDPLSPTKTYFILGFADSTKLTTPSGTPLGTDQSSGPLSRGSCVINPPPQQGYSCSYSAANQLIVPRNNTLCINFNGGTYQKWRVIPSSTTGNIYYLFETTSGQFLSITPNGPTSFVGTNISDPCATPVPTGATKFYITIMPNILTPNYTNVFLIRYVAPDGTLTNNYLNVQGSTSLVALYSGTPTINDYWLFFDSSTLPTFSGGNCGLPNSAGNDFAF